MVNSTFKFFVHLLPTTTATIPLFMRFAAALFLAAGLVAAQAAHGGVMISFLAYPAYAFAGLGALCALPEAFRSQSRPWARLAMAVIALASYAGWRCAHAPDSGLAMVDAGLILACVAMWAGVSLAITRNDARFVFLVICLVAACVQVIFAIMQLVRHGEFSLPYWLSEQIKNSYELKFPNRPRGLFVNPNQFAWLMNAMALMALSLATWGRLRAVARITLLYLAGVFGAMTVLSASRGGMVSLLVGVCAFLALSLAAIISVRSRRLLLLGAGGVALALCAGAAYAAFSTSWVAQGRLDTLLQPDVRSGFIEQAFRQFQSVPLLGAGPGMFRYAARLYRTYGVAGDPLYVHDDWLQFLAEYGFMGFAILILVSVLTVVFGGRAFLALVRRASTATGSAMSNSGAFTLGAVCALVAGAVHGNVDFNMHVPANALLAAAMVGLITGMRPGERSPIRPMAWILALASLAAAAGIVTLVARRGEAEYRILQADNALSRGNAKEALDETERGLRRLSDDPMLLAQRGRALFEYESWLALTPESDSVVDETVLELSPEERAHVYQQSVDSFARAVQVQPMERTHHLGYAQALAELGRADDARNQYIEAIRLDPVHGYAWAKFGDFLNSREEVGAARRIYEIGAGLPGGEYCRNQVEFIDSDLQDAMEEKEME